VLPLKKYRCEIKWKPKTILFFNLKRRKQDTGKDFLKI